jgi:hypothetical protein
LEGHGRGGRSTQPFWRCNGYYGLVYGDLHPSNILDGGPARGLVAIAPRPSRGDRTWDTIDLALARVTSADELDNRNSRIVALVPGPNVGRLRQWCQATAMITVVQRLFRPLDRADVLRLWSLLTLGRVELDLLVLIQRPVAGA